MISLNIKKGTYIVCVSGGVDSVVLLDIVSKMTDLKLIVAHFDHGIRHDSPKDSALVEKLANEYGIPFETDVAALGLKASEESARQARYEFLCRCREKYKADGLLLAHHQDDVLETIIINLLRGTGWRGLSSLRSVAPTYRPMLHTKKTDIRAYAAQHKLSWNEDTTNADQTYLRNYVRLTLLPKMLSSDPAAGTKLLDLYARQVELIHPISEDAAKYIRRNTTRRVDLMELSRYDLIMMPESVALEILQSAVVCLTRQRLLLPQAKRLLHFSKSADEGKRFEATKQVKASISHGRLIVEAVSGVIS